MTHPATISLALRDAGMSCRTEKGKLFVNPVANLQGELREEVITHRAALIDWLERAPDDDARIDALAEDAAQWNPFDHPDIPPPVLVRVSRGDERPKYVAIDPVYWDAFAKWTTDVRAANARRNACQEVKRKTKRKQSQPGFEG